MLLKRDPANPAPAEEALQTAIAVAKRQATHSFELRAALSLAKLYQSTGRPVEAHDVLAPALEGFPIPSPLEGEGEGGGSGHAFPVGRPEGADRKGQREPPPRPAPARGAGERAAGAMPEIAEARALLAELGGQ